MIFVGKFDEFSSGMGFPSIKTCISENEHPHKAEIVNYLKNGHVHGVTAGLFKDVFTGGFTGKKLYFMDDGVYSWSSRLPYYVEKYNVILPEDFIEHIINGGSQNDKADR